MAIKHNQQIQKNHFHKDWYYLLLPLFLFIANNIAGSAVSACTLTR